MLVPYKVYKNNKLIDLHYDKTSATLKSIKEKLIASGLPKSITIKKFEWRK